MCLLRVLARVRPAGGMPDLLLWRVSTRSTSSAVASSHADALGTHPVSALHTQSQTTSIASLPANSPADVPASSATFGEARLVEVKSERDRLSDQQRAWIDLMLRNGVRVEECRVGPDKQTDDDRMRPEGVAGCVAGCVAGSVADSVVDCVADSLMDDVADSVVDCVADSLMDDVADSMVGSVPDSVVGSVAGNFAISLTSSLDDSLDKACKNADGIKKARRDLDACPSLAASAAAAAAPAAPAECDVAAEVVANRAVRSQDGRQYRHGDRQHLGHPPQVAGAAVAPELEQPRAPIPQRTPREKLKLRKRPKSDDCTQSAQIVSDTPVTKMQSRNRGTVA
eukprot:2753061-Pleurochrysis_carterae.AAC.1